MAGVESWLPRFDVRERHAMELPVAPERALEIALALPAAPDWIVRLLIAGRGMAARREPIERFFLAHRFVELERGPREWVVGAVGARLAAARRARPPHRRRRLPRGARGCGLATGDGDACARRRRPCAPSVPGLLAGGGPVLGAHPP